MTGSNIYLVGAPDDEDFWPTARALREREWVVKNYPIDLGLDLTHQLRRLVECHAVCYLQTWWTTEQGNSIQVVAGLMRMPVISADTFELLTRRQRAQR